MPTLPKPLDERFAQSLAAGVDQTTAFIRAGCRAKSSSGQKSGACRLAQRPHVKARVAEILETAALIVEVDRSWVIAQLVDNVNRCKQAVPVFDRDGNKTGDWNWEPAAANRALELIGKDLGMFSDTIEIRDPPLIGSKPMDEDEWIKKYSPGLAAAAGTTGRTH